MLLPARGERGKLTLTLLLPKINTQDYSLEAGSKINEEAIINKRNLKVFDSWRTLCLPDYLLGDSKDSFATFTLLINNFTRHFRNVSFN